MSEENIIYVGLDVDDTAFYGAGINRVTGEIFEFKCKPDHGVVRKKIIDLFTDKANIRLCYEAYYIGFSLCRFLRKSGIHCDIIAPSLIPLKTGTRVKTDRLDALKLAQFYAKELLTPTYVPDETDEEIRDVVRSRNFLVKQQMNCQNFRKHSKSFWDNSKYEKRKSLKMRFPPEIRVSRKISPLLVSN